MGNNNYKCLSSFALKILAILTMTIDHVGAILGTKNYDGILPYDTYMISRTIGRLAFPIFCYLIVEGYFHTRSVKKYAIRLLGFAVISQLPYNLALKGGISHFYNLNIFFTLLFGLILVWLIDTAIKKIHSKEEVPHQGIILPYLFAVLAIFYAVDNFLPIDYGVYGLLLILVFYFFRAKEETLDNPDAETKALFAQFVAMGAISFLFSSQLQIYSLFALIPIAMHNHKKGKGLKYMFYTYYPLHLLIIYFISIVL